MEIRKASVNAVESYVSAVQEVASEGRWLASDKGFSVADSLSFMKFCEKTDSVQLFLVDNDVVVGWCDIVPHVGVRTGSLGIGIVKDYRGKGWGGKLLDAALAEGVKRFDKIKRSILLLLTGKCSKITTWKFGKRR